MEMNDLPNTRYTTISNPPPELPKICRLLKDSCQRGLVKKQGDIRAIAKQASREYSGAGPADDLARFLWNQGVIVQDKSTKRIYFDAERAVTVMHACEERIVTEAKQDPAVRLAALRGEPPSSVPADRVAVASAPAEKGPVVSEPQEEAPISTELDEEPEEEARVLSESVEVASTVATDDDFFALMRRYQFALPLDHDETAWTPIADERYALFLTPIEREVWDSLVLSIDDVEGEERLGIYNDDERLWKMWCTESTRKNISPKEFRRFVDRFVTFGLLRECGPSGKGMTAYRMAVPKSHCCVMPIERRQRANLVLQTHERIIRELVEMFGGTPTTPEVLLQALRTRSDEERFGELVQLALGKTVSVSGCPHPVFGMFLLKPDRNGKTWALASWQGFGPYRFVSRTEMATVAAKICVFQKEDASEASRVFLAPFHWMRQILPGDDSTVYTEDGEQCDPLVDEDALRALTDAHIASQLGILLALQNKLPGWIESTKAEVERRAKAKKEAELRRAEIQRVREEIEQRRIVSARLEQEAQELETKLKNLEKV
jgi:BMFP domain-containing protein YqiC